MPSISDQTIALASMMQSAILIDQLANKGSLNQAAFDCSMDSLFTLDADSTRDIFGDISGLSVGLNKLQKYLNSEISTPNQSITYYILSMIKIASKLQKNDAVSNKIQQGFAKIEKNTQDFDFSPSSKITKIDDLYQQTISKIKPRIMVQGNQSFLTSNDNTSKIRTLLFSGIRAGILWRQLGGSRLKLLFSRKKYLLSAEQLLSEF